ncbi:hypothetical protein CDD82_6035 [Ophiocordyceps australis]|uniref:Methylenetetrahydrofolate reductase (NAD(P)H) n=1 Tax=Ophiocordyceps australis TaxID=1399860 RepID=A0A2C5YZ57_9HYPO|nr:hypothetical protein CDD82_6035 [Ophiocordyceps australis]
MRPLHLTASLLALSTTTASNTSADKITHKIASAAHDFVSLEFFPPKTPSGFTSLQSRVIRINEALQPLFVSVTWGAGGSAAQDSLRLGGMLQRDLGITTLLHVTCRGMTRRRLDETLRRARELGIRNILALKGDVPRDDGDADEASGSGEGSGEFIWAADLVRYIRRTHGGFFCIGVAGYPEGHFNASDAASRSVEHDVPYLVDKVSAGSDFIMTQIFFNASVFSAYRERLSAHPVLRSIPVVPLFLAIPDACATGWCEGE